MKLCLQVQKSDRKDSDSAIKVTVGGNILLYNTSKIVRQKTKTKTGVITVTQ